MHKLVPDRKLVLGGVEIPYPLGLLGHSDADVLIHAIIDAMLGAAGLGDIGELFPDTEEGFKDISSIVLLEEAYRQVMKLGYKIGNVDTILICQRPKLKDYKDKMKQKIAKALEISEMRINIKATTTEGLGFEGREEGISAQAILLLEEIKRD